VKLRYVLHFEGTNTLQTRDIYVRLIRRPKCLLDLQPLKATFGGVVHRDCPVIDTG
jgi:hypothetical protein